MNARKWITTTLILAFSALLAVQALAGPWQGWRGSGGWGMGGAYQRMYDPAKVEVLVGEVVSVDKITPMKGMNQGIHVMLKTAKETIPVHLGPSWYLERLDTTIEKGDSLEVKGSRITYNGKPAVIAAEVKKGDAVLKLRDDNGYPAWAGWRR